MGRSEHGIWGSEFEGSSIGLPIGNFCIGNLGAVNYGIREGEFKKSIGILIGTTQIGNDTWGSEFEEKSIGIPIGILRIGNLGVGTRYLGE